MLPYLLIFIATFSRVFLHGFQSRNIAHGHYKAAFCTSMLMTISEIAFVAGIVSHGWYAFFPMLIGGSLGVVSSMFTHQKLFTRKS